MSEHLELMLDALDKKLLGWELRRMVERNREVPAVFLLGLHEWGNIGDLAINGAEHSLLERVFAPHPTFTVSRSALAANWDRIRATITPDDLIAIHGGGNMGDIWPHEEAARLAIVAAFPDNAIVSLPQSIHFDNAADLLRSMAVYEAHPDLLVAVRDDRSAEIARTHLGAERVIRTEDSVTRTVLPFRFSDRATDVLFVRRDDKERRAQSQIDDLQRAVEASDRTSAVTDTTVERLPFSNRELAAKLTYQKIDELATARVVVTDRLHGAIFALIAGRPVVVFENSYGKIGGALATMLPRLSERVVFADGADPETVDAAIERLATVDTTDQVPSVLLADEHRAFDQALRSRARF